MPCLLVFLLGMSSSSAHFQRDPLGLGRPHCCVEADDIFEFWQCQWLELEGRKFRVAEYLLYRAKNEEGSTIGGNECDPILNGISFGCTASELVIAAP
jgi:hypothetical protein